MSDIYSVFQCMFDYNDDKNGKEKIKCQLMLVFFLVKNWIKEGKNYYQYIQDVGRSLIEQKLILRYKYFWIIGIICFKNQVNFIFNICGFNFLDLMVFSYMLICI